MRRREFLGVLSGAAAAWPVRARAQTRSRSLRIGLVMPGALRTSSFWPSFSQRLNELGYKEGLNLAADVIDLNGSLDRYGEAMRDLVRRNVDIIIAHGPELSLKSAVAATDKVPIVMVAIDYDPLALGYLSSLARPGGNVTGLFYRQIELAAKRVQLFKDAFPEINAAALFWDQISADQWSAARDTGANLGLRFAAIELRDYPYDYEKALAQVPSDHRGVLFVMVSGLFLRDRARIVEFAKAHRLPTVFGLRDWVDTGGLLSYGADFIVLNRRAADYVDRLAKGAKPPDLPIEQPSKYQLVVNLKTAKAIGVTVPTSLLLRADEVIE